MRAAASWGRPDRAVGPKGANSALGTLIKLASSTWRAPGPQSQSDFTPWPQAIVTSFSKERVVRVSSSYPQSLASGIGHPPDHHHQMWPIRS